MGGYSSHSFLNFYFDKSAKKQDESKLHREKQYLVFMLHISRINCWSDAKLCSFKSRLKSFPPASAFALNCTVTFTLAFLMLYLTLCFYLNAYIN